MFGRGYLAWLIAALALSPMTIDAQDTTKPAPGAKRPVKDVKTNAPAAAESDKETETEVDDELLEFLGSVDSEDEEMIDYLAKTDELP